MCNCHVKHVKRKKCYLVLLNCYDLKFVATYVLFSAKSFELNLWTWKNNSFSNSKYTSSHFHFTILTFTIQVDLALILTIWQWWRSNFIVNITPTFEVAVQLLCWENSRTTKRFLYNNFLCSKRSRRRRKIPWRHNFRTFISFLKVQMYFSQGSCLYNFLETWKAKKSI